LEDLMSRLATALLSGVVALSAAAASAATVLPMKGPFTFTGTVASAAAPCPYAAKAQLAGYTIVTGFQQFPTPSGTYVGSKGFDLVISPGGKLPKTVLNVGGFTLAPHAASASGALKAFALPSTNEGNGSYNIALTFVSKTQFSSKLTIKYGTCTAVYNLSFAKGIPANLLNIL
jgi:hypothetical protein